MHESIDTNTLNNLADRKLVSVPLGTSVEDALEILNLNGVHHLAVINQRGDFIGLLAEKDITNLHEPQRLTVEIFMSSPVERIHHEASLRTVALRMLEKKVASLLVVDSDNNALGIITSEDLLWQLAHLLKDEKSASPPIKSILNLQTLGRVANDLASVGI